MSKIKIVIFAFLGVAVAVTGFVVAQLGTHHHPGSKPQVHSSLSAHKRTSKGCAPPDVRDHYLGVLVYRPWRATLPAFEHQTGVRPKMVEYYVGFGAPFDLTSLKHVYRSGLPIIQVDPRRATVQGIADGKYDSYLKSQAKAVARFKCPVAISFGHEMNGNWYPWGATHVTPAAFIAAWRHIYDVFHAAGAHNVKWTWTINRVSAYVTSIKQWWPGNKYVNYVGIDGYYRKPGQGFGYIFGQTIRQLRSFTHDPILITETSVIPEGPQSTNIENLFQGAKKMRVLGVVWFNVNAKERWSLAGRPASVIRAFKEAVRAYEG